MENRVCTAVHDLMMGYNNNNNNDNNNNIIMLETAFYDMGM